MLYVIHMYFVKYSMYMFWKFLLELYFGSWALVLIIFGWTYN